MAALKELFTSREFQTSKTEGQRQLFAQADKGFAKLSPREQYEILGEIDDKYGRAWHEGKFFDSILRGAARAGSGFTHAAVNAVDLNEPDAIREGMGRKPQSELETWLKTQEETLFDYGTNPEGESTALEIAGEAIGGVGVAIPSYAGIIGAGAAALISAGVPALTAGTISAIGLAGFGMGALTAADRGWLESLKAGTQDAAFFALFPALRGAGATRLQSMFVLGDTAFMMTPEEMDIGERLGHGATMAILGGLQKPGPKRAPRFREPELAAKAEAEKVLTGLSNQRGAELAEREQIANDRLRLPRDPEKAAEMERKIEELPAEERQMIEDIRAAEKSAESTIESEIQDRVQSLRLQWAQTPDAKQKGFIEAEIDYLTRETTAVNRPAELPAAERERLADLEVDIDRLENYIQEGLSGAAHEGQRNSFIKDQNRLERMHAEYNELSAKDVRPPREEPGSQGDLPGETARGRPAEAADGERLALGQGREREPGFQGEEQTFRGDFEERLGKMGEYKDPQLPPGGDAGGGAPGLPAPAEAAPPAAPQVRHQSTKGDRRRLEYIDDGHGALWMMRKSGMEDMPDNVYQKFGALRGIPSAQDGMVKWGVPQWVADPLEPSRKIVKFMETPAYDVTRVKSTVSTPNSAETFETWGYEATPSATRTHKGAGDIIMKILGKGKKYEKDSWDYFRARQSNELITQTIDPRTGEIRPSTPREIAELKTREKNWNLEQIEEGLKKADPTRVATYEAMKHFQRQMADFYVDSGFITRDQVNAWRRKEYAFGFQRATETGRSGRHRTGDELSAAYGIHRLWGSKRDLRDPYVNWVTGPQDLFRAALQNKWQLETVDKMMELGGFAERVSPQSRRVTVGRGQLKNALVDDMVKNEGLTEAQAAARMRWLGDMPGDIERLGFFVGANKPYGSDIVSVIRGGRPEYYKVYDPVLMRTFESVNRNFAQGFAGRFMAGFKRFKQGLITIDPSFIVANGVRDPAMATMMTRTGHQHMTAAINGWKHTILRSPEYKEFIANGGGGATMRDGIRVTRRRLVAKAKRAERHLLDPRNLLLGPADIWRLVHEFGRGMETGPRVGEFLRARRTGMKGPGKGEPATMGEAVAAGREVSTDFAKRGGGQPTEIDGVFGTRWGPAANRFLVETVPFYSAMLASSDRGYRAVFRDPHGKAGSAFKIGMVGVSSMFLYGLNRWLAEKYGHLKDEQDRPYVDFLNLPAWQKQAYWHFYVPTRFNAETGEPVEFKHFHMPKLWEVGMIASLAERWTQSMFESDEDDRTLARDMLDTVAHNFNFKTDGRGLPVPLPAGIDIMVEQAMNKILFTGQPIETSGMGELEPWARDRSDTPRTLQEFSQAMRNVPGIPEVFSSPARAEALLRGVFGNWAAMGLQVTDQVFFPGGPALGWDDLPVVRRFYSEPGKYDRNTELYYRNLEELSQAHGTFMEMQKRGEYEIADQMMLDPDQLAMIQMAPGFDRANRRLQLLNREMNMVKRGVAEPDATPRERHRILNQLEADRNGIMKSLNELAKFFKQQARIEASRNAD